MSKVYDDSSIQVLEDIQHIRLRSSMYISTDRPSFQMFDEIFSNALDEVVNGYSNSLYVDINYLTGVVRVEDRGRGLPQGRNEELGISTIEVIYGKLNSGGKYNRESYAVSGGLNGVGSCVVNALSEFLEVETWRNRKAVCAKFSRGELEYINTDVSVDEEGSGTRVTFRNDPEHKLFSEDNIKMYEHEILDKISLVKTLLPKVNVYYNGSPVDTESFHRFLPKTKEYLFNVEETPRFFNKDLSLVLNWSKDNNRQENFSYCNFIYNKNGGDHERGVGDAVAEYFNDGDALLGLKIAVSVFYPDVEYDSQAKVKAVSRELRVYTKEQTLNLLRKYFRENPTKKAEVLSMIKLKRAAIDRRNNKSNVVRDRKSSFLSSLGVDGFSDCSTTNRSEAEMYICEGLSAAGSLKQARDTKTQAVLPLRGKVINAYNADVVSLLKNKEVVSLVSNIDVGVFDDVNVRKSRYGKVIITCDADPDGKNIAVLLLSLFMKVMPELVEEGYVYLALPPLYGTTIKGKFIPINTEEEKEEHLKKGHYVQRYKGLGEMNPEQLYSSVMDPTTRTLVNVTLSEDCSEVVANISGGDSSYRREILTEMGVLV